MEKAPDDQDEGSDHSGADDDGDAGNRSEDTKPASNDDEIQKELEKAWKQQPPEPARPYRKVHSDGTAPRSRRAARRPLASSGKTAATDPIHRTVRFGKPDERHDNEAEHDEDVESQVDLLSLVAQRSRGIYRDAYRDEEEEQEIAKCSKAAAHSAPGVDLLGSANDNLREEKLRSLADTFHSSITTAEIQSIADSQAKAYAKNQTYNDTTTPHTDTPGNDNSAVNARNNTQQRTNNNADDIIPGAYQAAPGQGIVRTEEFHGILRHPLADENPNVRSSGNAANIDLDINTEPAPPPIDYTASGEVISAIRVDEDDLELNIRDEITNNAAQAEVVDLEKETATIVESNMKQFRKQYICYGTIVLVVLTAIILALAFGLTKAKNEVRDNDNVVDHVVFLPSLEAIRERGYLNCGLTPRVDIAEYDSTFLEGGIAFQEAICTAIASAALGGYPNVSLHTVSEADRWLAMKNGTLDVLLVGTPSATDSVYWKLDPTIDVTFSTPFYYDGVGTGGLPDYVGNCANRSGYFNQVACRDLKVCVVQGSEAWEEAQELLHPSQVLTVTSPNDLYAKFVAGCCNVISTDYSNSRSETMVREKTGYDGPYAIGQGLFSIQPYAVATLRANWTQHDAHYDDVDYDIRVMKDSHIFSEMVDWTILSLVAAEERNITQSTADRFPITNVFGTEFRGIFRNALVGGNYGEIYERTMQPTVPRARMNMLNNGTTGLHLGQLYGDLSDFGPPPHENGTLRAILDRGELRCGIPMPSNFTSFSPITGLMEPLPFPPFRFDVLVTLKGDGRDLDTVVGTANIDLNYCRALASSVLLGHQQSIGDATCSVQSHDFQQIPEDLMPKLQFVLLDNEASGYTKLATGEIDVIAGYRMELQDDIHEEVSGEGYTFSQPYLYGPTLSGRVTDANRCLVTRDYDDQWSAYVQSIVASLFYAEENQITQAKANQMPAVNRFGPTYKRMFRDAVFEVGNYAEIYERSVEPHLTREGGPNMLNTEAGPQFASRPGLF